jgi:hypothetical protein
MDAIKFSPWHKGFLAFRSGKALRNIRRGIKVFHTEEAAKKALAKSKAV